MCLPNVTCADRPRLFIFHARIPHPSFPFCVPEPEKIPGEPLEVRLTYQEREAGQLERLSRSTFRRPEANSC